MQLPISTLPKFDFSLPPPTTTISSPKRHKNEYKFSSPISINDAPKTNLVSINNFKFSQPIGDSQFNYVPPSATPKKKDVSKNNGQNFNFIAPAETLVSGSVMDVLGKTEPAKDNLMERFKPASGTWECSACMVRNIPSATRCVACETMREPAKTPVKFGTEFCISAGKWECPVCMVRNDDKEVKCVACTAQKPGSAPVPESASTPTPSFGFGNQFKPPANTWECAVCMVRNQSTAVKCVACETPKPGAPKADKPGFSDLIQKQQARWECKTCLIRNPMDKIACLSCETIRPDAPKDPTPAPKFKFGINNTGFKFGIDSSDIKKPETPSTGFKFGVNQLETPASEFKFGMPQTVTATKPIEKPAKAAPKPTAETIEIVDSDDEAKKDVIVIEDEPVAKKPKAKPDPMPTPMFKFGQPSSTVDASLNTETPTFSFGTKPPETKPAPSPTPIPIPTFKFTPAPETVTTEPPKTEPTPSFVFGQGTKSATAESPKPLFSFGASNFGTPTTTAPVSSEPKLPLANFTTPNFNFGGSLPFNPTKPTTAPAPTFVFTTTTTKPSFTIGATPAPAPAPAPAPVKPFSFGNPESSGDVSSSSAAPAQQQLFNFGKGDATAAPLVAPPPVFERAPLPAFGTPMTKAPPVPQNGGFNFGGAASAASFKFGASSNAPAPIFSFGTSQVIYIIIRGVAGRKIFFITG